MRQLQVGIFVLALAAFITSVFFIGSDTGDALWRAGVAGLLIDMVAIKLWPAHPATASNPGV